MTSIRSAAGAPDNSITVLLPQRSASNREVDARLIPQICEGGKRAVKRERCMARAWVEDELSKQP
jgi:hypothetical protein